FFPKRLRARPAGRFSLAWGAWLAFRVRVCADSAPARYCALGIAANPPPWLLPLTGRPHAAGLKAPPLPSDGAFLFPTPGQLRAEVLERATTSASWEVAAAQLSRMCPGHPPRDNRAPPVRWRCRAPLRAARPAPASRPLPW